MNFKAVMINNNKLTQHEVEIIKRTWGKVGDSVEVAIDFYNRLFYLSPVIRPMFKENIRLQARKFTTQISVLVEKISLRDAGSPEMNAFGKLHRATLVRPDHYGVVKEALFYTLKSHLKEEWNDCVEMAWIKFYKIIAATMMSSSHYAKS